MNRKLTIEDEAGIIELSKTVSQNAIAKQYNVSQKCIGNVLKRNGIKKQKRTRLLIPGQLPLIVDYFATIDTPHKAYWLGFLAADGHIRKGKVVMTSKDLEVIVGFKEAIASGHAVTSSLINDERTGKQHVVHSIQITNETFAEYVSAAGVTNSKSALFSLPLVKTELQPYLLAGLFDGDGSISTANGSLRLNLISTYEALVEIQSIISKLANNKPTKLQRIMGNHTNVWKLYVYKDARNFLDYIYQDPAFPYLTRKFNKYKEACKTFCSSI